MSAHKALWAAYALVLTSWLCVACRPSADGEPDDDATARPSPRSAAGEEPGEEVQLSAEAVERAGIVLTQVDKRALSSGAAIAAEVQFDPSSTAHVGPLATGRITRVAVELGQEVQRGSVLGVVSSGDVSTVRSRLVQARARLDAASATLRRQQQLSREGIGAQRALIDAQAARSELLAEVQGLQHRLSTLGSGEGGELSLVSPIDGIVVSVRGTLGETASADQAVFVVTDPKRVWVRGDVPELEIARVALGDAAIVRLHAYPELSLAGTITYIAPALDERTRSLPIRVSLADPDPRLRSGMFGSVELRGGSEDSRVLAVPVDAVTSLDGQDVVFVAGKAPGSFRATAVTLGRRAAGYYEVQHGLSEGDSVAACGSFTIKSALRAHELSDGDPD